MLHPAGVPHQLVTHAVQGLVAIACARGPSSPQAAALLSELLAEPRMGHWLMELGDVNALTTR
jgi:hypothetical protein